MFAKQIENQSIEIGQIKKKYRQYRRLHYLRLRLIDRQTTKQTNAHEYLFITATTKKKMKENNNT